MGNIVSRKPMIC